MNSIRDILPKLLSKAQEKFLATLISTIMVMCGKVNFTNLSRYSEINERTYRRQFLRSILRTVLEAAAETLTLALAFNLSEV